MKGIFCLLAFIPLVITDEGKSEGLTKAFDATAVRLEDLQWAANEGIRQVDALIRLEDQLLEKGLVANKRGPRHRRSSINKLRNSKQARREAIKALHIVEASKKLKDRLELSANQARSVLPQLSLKGTALEASCWEPVVCPTDSKYRSIDGSCNNLLNQHWGEKGTPFQRFLPPAYGNGIDSLRVASDGLELPNPRGVIDGVISSYGRDDYNNATLALMTFGQFITHDMTYSEDFTFENGSSPACCGPDGQYPLPGEMHPQCCSIRTGSDVSKSNCMSMTRSKCGVDLSCTFGYAEQLNSNTHFLDGSQIYGSDETTMMELREGVDGLMKTSRFDGRQLLPITPGCQEEVNHELAVCFQAGDVRVEENPQLTALHLVMLREHNRIARELKRINPGWNDEILFQETRRIVVAELQHITYNEYLPIMLGDRAMEQFGLSTATTGYGSGYRADVDPSVSNDFTAAAFRIAHSSIQGYLQLFNALDQEDEDRSFSLSEYFFDASRFVDDNAFLDSVLRGLTKQVPQVIDTFYSSEVIINLYKGKKEFGSDLVAITVQRGREHGIPDYNSFREMCGLARVESFDDLYKYVLDEKVIYEMKRYYRSVDDIDLYIGCLAEYHLPGAKIGPTGLCIIGKQFANTKHGDRFFYDLGGQPHSFTLDQLDQIRRTSLARLMCDNNDGTVTSMQPLALRSPEGSNARIPCSSIPSVDLSYWK